MSEQNITMVNVGEGHHRTFSEVLTINLAFRDWPLPDNLKPLEELYLAAKSVEPAEVDIQFQALTGASNKAVSLAMLKSLYLNKVINDCVFFHDLKTKYFDSGDVVYDHANNKVRIISSNLVEVEGDKRAFLATTEFTVGDEVPVPLVLSLPTAEDGRFRVLLPADIPTLGI